MSNCPYCLGIRARRIYCRHCKPAPPKPKPDKIVLVIRYPKTVEDKRRMLESIKPYSQIRPVFVYSSPVAEPLAIAEELAATYLVSVTQNEGLAPGGRVNPRAIESLVPPAIGIGLYIFVTHEPHAKLAYRGYYGMFYSVARPAQIKVNPGEVVVIDFMYRRTFKK